MTRPAVPTASAWLLTCGLHGTASLLLMLLIGPADAARALAWRADHWAGQPWTLWTSAWVHLSAPHLLGNLLALGALAAAGGIVRPGLHGAAAWWLAWPLVPLSLLLWPPIGYAAGLSGLLHAGAALLAMHLLLVEHSPIRHARHWGALLALGLLAKTALEHGWADPVARDPVTGMPVVQAAHLCGVAWGALLGWAAAATRDRFRPRRRTKAKA